MVFSFKFIWKSLDIRKSHVAPQNWRAFSGSNIIVNFIKYSL